MREDLPNVPGNNFISKDSFVADWDEHSEDGRIPNGKIHE